MNPLHLLWIVPFSFYFGFMIAACMAAAKRGDNEDKEERD